MDNLNLKIQQKTEDMIRYAYGVLAHFPKSERFTLCADVKRTTARMLELIVRANKARNKTSFLVDLDIEIDVLRAQIRLAHRLGFLPIKKYEIWSEHVMEIGRMLGGWLKYARGARL